MGHIDDRVQVPRLAACLAFLSSTRRWVRESNALLWEKFIEEIDNLPRGGPPAPMHPSPAGDALLRRPSKKVAEIAQGC
jgi:hypothetical protein